MSVEVTQMAGFDGRRVAIVRNVDEPAGTSCAIMLQQAVGATEEAGSRPSAPRLQAPVPGSSCPIARQFGNPGSSAQETGSRHGCLRGAPKRRPDP